MRRYSTADLRTLEIVNLCNGARLGYASDFEFDAEDARILSLIINGKCGFFGWKKEDDLIIPWCKIECIGEDTILVKLSPNDLGGCSCPQGKRKSSFFFGREG